MVDDEGNAIESFDSEGRQHALFQRIRSNHTGANHVPGLTIIGLKDFCHFLWITESSRTHLIALRNHKGDCNHLSKGKDKFPSQLFSAGFAVIGRSFADGINECLYVV